MANLFRCGGGGGNKNALVVFSDAKTGGNSVAIKSEATYTVEHDGVMSVNLFAGGYSTSNSVYGGKVTVNGGTPTYIDSKTLISTLMGWVAYWVFEVKKGDVVYAYVQNQASSTNSTTTSVIGTLFY